MKENEILDRHSNIKNIQSVCFSMILLYNFELVIVTLKVNQQEESKKMRRDFEIEFLLIIITTLKHKYSVYFCICFGCLK
jgi:hypothetical protein